MMIKRSILSNKQIIQSSMVPVLTIAIILGVSTIASTHNAFAYESINKRYNDGYSNGLAAGQSDGQNGNAFNSVCDPNKQFTSDGKHTPTYCNGWAAGYQVGFNGQSQTTTNVQYQQGGSTGNSGGGTNWSDICNKISFALNNQCSDLVNPDNTLTSQGIHVRNCIETGALLAGGALLLGAPPTAIVSAIPFAAKLGGCGDVLNTNALSLSQLHGLGGIISAAGA